MPPRSLESSNQSPVAATGTALLDQFAIVRQSMNQQLAGHEKLVERLLVAAITGGHVLIEGAPGLAKTRTVNCFANLINASFGRVQATPDLLPADLIGTNVYQQHSGSFTFIKGPLFNNIVLVDEINRAPPKVQSALLEAMGEKQISAAGQTYPLADPFIVVATQNPIEHEGTYPLPEAQLDRFTFFVHVKMPTPQLEQQILNLVLNESTAEHNSTPLIDKQPTLQPDAIRHARSAATEVYLSDAVRDYVVRLVTATRGYGNAGREAEAIEHAASPRGSIFLARTAKARAWLAGRDHVIPDDVAILAPDILSGRIVLNYQAQAQGASSRQIIHRILDATPVV